MKQETASGSSTVFGDILPPPSLSPFFVGRNEERRKLLRVLERCGSAAITQYGGAGKTQLMVSFAESAREHGLVPGGIFWVTAHGNKEKFCLRFLSSCKVLGSVRYLRETKGVLGRWYVG